MATTGTYNFNPSFGELAAQAFRRVQVPRQALTEEHLLDAQNEANLMLLDWANKGPNLWAIEELTIPLLAGQATYDLPFETVDMLDTWVSFTDNGVTVDRLMQPIMRSEYASYGNKSTEGVPSVYWMNKTVTPTVTLFPVPESDNYTLKWYRLRWQQDTEIANAQTVDVHRLWLAAFVSGLAAVLAVIYKPEAFQALDAIAKEKWQTAAEENVEDGNLYITPNLSGYYR